MEGLQTHSVSLGQDPGIGTFDFFENSVASISGKLRGKSKVQSSVRLEDSVHILLSPRPFLGSEGDVPAWILLLSAPRRILRAANFLLPSQPIDTYCCVCRHLLSLPGTASLQPIGAANLESRLPLFRLNETVV